jgi:hypothetical protein
MMTCPHCGGSHPATARFCPISRKPIPQPSKQTPPPESHLFSGVDTRIPKEAPRVGSFLFMRLVIQALSRGSVFRRATAISLYVSAVAIGIFGFSTWIGVWALVKEPLKNAPPTEDEEAPPTSSDRNVDEEEFRKHVRILVRNRGGQLQVGEITRLMQEAIEDYKLKPSVAKRIIDEEQRQNSVKVEPDPRSVEKYRQTVLDVTDNGTREISDEGRQVLEAKRKRLGLTPEQASAIEAEVLRELYKMEAE